MVLAMVLGIAMALMRGSIVAAFMASAGLMTFTMAASVAVF